MKREKSLWILAIIALLLLVVWNLRLHAEPGGAGGAARQTTPVRECFVPVPR